MHRMKIGLAAAVVLLLVTFAVHRAVTSKLQREASAEVEADLAQAVAAFAELSELRASHSAMQAFERAKRPTVVAVFDPTDETDRREAAFAECEALNAGLAKEGQKAAIVAILDASGKVIARDLNPNAMWGEDLKASSPAVAEALKGEPTKDVWAMDGRMTQVAIAPIRRNDGAALGALLIGHAMSARLAQRTRDLIGVDIGYFHQGKMQASSFGSRDDGTREDLTRTQALGSLVFGEAGLAKQALESGEATPMLRQTIEGEEYAVVAAPLRGSFADRSGGVVLFASLADAMIPFANVGLAILLFGLTAIVVALGAAVLTAKRFIAPLDKIELGVAEIINGNIDYTFRPVGPDFEGLSNALNVMLARLLGREEPSEDAIEDEEDGKKLWRADQMVIEEGEGEPVPADDPLAKESEAAYYPRLFTEYSAELVRTGRPAQGISIPAFMAKLRLAEAGLKHKWTCKKVRFKLVRRGDEPVLRAVRIG